ncbi:hypothetical protein BQ8482_380083 [Mesorhizobium delmotii]|uniref:Uncharacterized protein n=1 Tax=Mesorhizobium delmotii TaxID=1631247 RepID=A0A2P9ARW3_9HYPH|nr:hypothetical protein BQ8482_380083 [Mesorhizobium delmotii]
MPASTATPSRRRCSLARTATSCMASSKSAGSGQNPTLGTRGEYSLTTPFYPSVGESEREVVTRTGRSQSYVAPPKPTFIGTNDIDPNEPFRQASSNVSNVVEYDIGQPSPHQPSMNAFAEYW